ncbi:MAG TPA: penicillin acylase family protein, partial [Bryobacterales bacterium]|nr:penicillin acylase family protein [Bryobacterales bacterium]
EIYTSQMSTVFVQEALEARPAGWTKDYDELLLRSLDQAIRDRKALPGAAATWGRYLETTIAHPVGHHVPVLRRWFDIGPFPASGTTTTIKQTTTRLAPSMRMVVDLADLDRSLHNLTTGESGQPFSKHYKDQWEAYYAGRSFPLEFSKPEVVERLEFRPEN